MIDDPFGKERGPEGALEAAERFEADFEHVRERAEQLLDRLTEELRLSEEDVTRLAVVFFGRYLDLTRAPDTVVLVVRGSVAPYDSALQVLLAGDPEARVYDELLHRLDQKEASRGSDG